MGTCLRWKNPVVITCFKVVYTALHFSFIHQQIKLLFWLKNVFKTANRKYPV